MGRTTTAFKGGAQAARRFTRVKGLQMALESPGCATPPELANGELAKRKAVWCRRGADWLPLPAD
eukprot:6795221-Pyramimonas_sp.AAC.1